MNLAKESLEFLLDAVTQRYVNNINISAPTPSIVNHFGDINKDVDLDVVAEYTKKKIGQEIIEYSMTHPDIKRG